MKQTSFNRVFVKKLTVLSLTSVKHDVMRIEEPTDFTDEPSVVRSGRSLEGEHQTFCQTRGPFVDDEQFHIEAWKEDDRHSRSG